MYMYHYATTADPAHSQRKAVEEGQMERVRKEAAFHVTALAVEAPDENYNEAFYKGDLWFDVDHKNLSDAIESARRLVDGLAALDVRPEWLKYYASGRKGFHLCIPARVFRPDEEGVKRLNVVYRVMAQSLEDKCAIALDMKPYDGKTGGFLRVENKPRPDNRYKVPITFDEFSGITVEMYEQITASPREIPSFLIPKNAKAQELNKLYTWAVQVVAKLRDQVRYTSLETSELAEFVNGNYPECVSWLATGTVSVKPKTHWNQVALQVATFAASAPGSNPDLLPAVAGQHTSSRFPTEADRLANLEYLTKYAPENGIGFACGAMKNLFSQSPCSNCPVLKRSLEKLVELIPVTATSKGYFDEEEDQISDFTLLPRTLLKQVRESGKLEFSGIGVDIMANGMAVSQETLSTEIWGEPELFGNIVRYGSQCSFWGTSRQLIHIYRLVRAEIVRLGEESLVKMKVEKLGIQQVPSPSGDGDEWHYVEPGWSLGENGIENYCQYTSPRNAANTRMLKIRGIRAIAPEFTDPLDTLKELLHTNYSHTLAVIVGWCCATQVKQHLRLVRRRTEFPLLGVIGPTGSGKSQTMQVWGTLAGSFNQDGMMNIGRLTAWPLKKAVSEFTTNAVLLDEYTPRLMRGDSGKQITNTLKSVYCSESASNGFITPKKQVSSEDLSSTSSVCYISTDAPEELEVKNRSLEVFIQPTTTSEFGEVFNEVMMKRDIQSDLHAVYTTLVRYALLHGEDFCAKEVPDIQDNLPAFITRRFDRLMLNWLVPFLGIRLLKAAIHDSVGEHDVLNKLTWLEGRLSEWLLANQAAIEERATLDSMLETLQTWAVMAQLPVGDYYRLQPVYHYYREPGFLYIKVPICFDALTTYCQRVNRVAHFSNARAMLMALKGKRYFEGVSHLAGLDPKIMFMKFALAELPELDMSGFTMVSPLDTAQPGGL